jgi:tetratricopeptide (TPR) repeat protein
MGAIGQLFDANGVRNDLTLTLFALDHGQATPDALERARIAYEDRPSLAAADVYAWALYRAGDFAAARQHAEEALRLGTKEPLYLFHAGMIANAQGDTAAAISYLASARKLNGHFSVAFAGEAATTLKQLQGSK